MYQQVQLMNDQLMRKFDHHEVVWILLLLSALILSACAEVTPGSTMSPEATDTELPSSTLAPSFTLTITPTLIPTNTSTITPSSTSTITLTPTSEYPIVKVNVRAAHCRYGPSKAYLHAADLYEGDRGFVHGRFQYSNWLYVKWEKLAYRCWVSPYVVDVVGEINQIGYASIGLERIPSTLYTPPQNVRASREGDLVTIYWNRVPMTEDDDRGYMIEAFVCQEGAYLWWTARIESQFTTSYSVNDEDGCPFPSSGKIYTVEKHGYTEATVITWPP